MDDGLVTAGEVTIIDTLLVIIWPILGTCTYSLIVVLTYLCSCHVRHYGEVVGGGILSSVLVFKVHLQLCLEVVHCRQLL